MPLYEFECPEGHRFTARMSSGDLAQLKGWTFCEDCGGDAKRVYSPAPFVFAVNDADIRLSRNRFRPNVQEV